MKDCKESEVADNPSLDAVLYRQLLSEFQSRSLEANLETHLDLRKLYKENFNVDTEVTLNGEETNLLEGVNSKSWAQTKEFIKALNYKTTNIFIVLDIEAMGPTNEYALKSTLERGPGRRINLVDIYLRRLKTKMEKEFPGCKIIKHGGDEFLMCGTILSDANTALGRKDVQDKFAVLSAVRDEVLNLSEEKFAELQAEYQLDGSYEEYQNACANSLRLAHYREIRRTLNKDFDKEHGKDTNAQDNDTLAHYIQFLQDNYYRQKNKDELGLFLKAYKDDPQIKEYINQEFIGKADEVCALLRKLSEEKSSLEPFEKIQALEHWVSILRGFPREIPEELEHNGTYTELHRLFQQSAFVKPPTLLGIHSAAYDLQNKPAIEETDDIYKRIEYGLGQAKHADDAQKGFSILEWEAAKYTITTIFQQAERIQDFETKLEDIAVSRFEKSLLRIMREEAKDDSMKEKINQRLQEKEEIEHAWLGSLLKAGQRDPDTGAYTPRYCAQSLNTTKEYQDREDSAGEGVFEVTDMHMSAGPINNFIGYKTTDDCVKRLVEALKTTFPHLVIVRTGPADVRLISTATKIDMEAVRTVMEAVNQKNIAYLKANNLMELNQAIRDAAGRNGLELFKRYPHLAGKAGQFVLAKERSVELTNAHLQKTLYELIDQAV